MFTNHLLIHIEVPLDFNQLAMQTVNKLEKKKSTTEIGGER